MLKILQARLQQYMNCEIPDVQAGFRKGRGTRDQIANIRWVIEKAREFQKTSALLTMLKPLTVWITTNCRKFWKRWEYQTTWLAFWEIRSCRFNSSVSKEKARKYIKQILSPSILCTETFGFLLSSMSANLTSHHQNCHLCSKVDQYFQCFICQYTNDQKYLVIKEQPLTNGFKDINTLAPSLLARIILRYVFYTSSRDSMETMPNNNLTCYLYSSVSSLYSSDVFIFALPKNIKSAQTPLKVWF